MKAARIWSVGRVTRWGRSWGMAGQHQIVDGGQVVASPLHGQLAQPAALKIQDEAADVIPVGNKRARPHVRDGVSQVGLYAGHRAPAERRSRPVSVRTSRLICASVKPTIPQSVWFMRMISVVPIRRCDIASERIASSVA